MVHSEAMIDHHYVGFWRWSWVMLIGCILVVLAFSLTDLLPTMALLTLGFVGLFTFMVATRNSIREFGLAKQLEAERDMRQLAERLGLSFHSEIDSAIADTLQQFELFRLQGKLQVLHLLTGWIAEQPVMIALVRYGVVAVDDDPPCFHIELVVYLENVARPFTPVLIVPKDHFKILVGGAAFHQVRTENLPIHPEFKSELELHVKKVDDELQSIMQPLTTWAAQHSATRVELGYSYMLLTIAYSDDDRGVERATRFDELVKSGLELMKRLQGV